MASIENFLDPIAYLKFLRPICYFTELFIFQYVQYDLRFGKFTENSFERRKVGRIFGSTTLVENFHSENEN